MCGRRPSDLRHCECDAGHNVAGWASYILIPIMDSAFTSSAVLEPTQTGEQPKYAVRRRFPRYRTELPVKIRNHDERELNGCCLVIAEGGLGANLPEPLPVGSVVQLRLALPTHPTLLNVWVIVRCQLGCHHGLEFLSLTEDERLSIRRLCSILAGSQQSR